jgi:hypothetical protein
MAGVPWEAIARKAFRSRTTGVGIARLANLLQTLCKQSRRKT